MGAGISGWQLARAVSSAGQLGVVAGTALDLILVRRLQSGDPGGHMRRALASFPWPEMTARILERYFVPGGRASGTGFRTKPLVTVDPSHHVQELLVAGNFAEVFLAREGHSNPVGLNLLEKIQLPTIPSLFGAMLAGVDVVLMGAGIPRAIPGILDALARGEPASLRVDVKDAGRDDDYRTHFDPRAFCGGEPPRLARPQFYAIISSAPLAKVMAKKASGRVDGFIVEGPTAGGHNAPPRARVPLTEAGEPVYGPRDVPDLEAIAELGLPFWLAGSYASPQGLRQARELGAVGIQVGTAFAYCEESGLAPALKSHILGLSRQGKARILTDAVASPTGFPFKVVQLDDTISDASNYAARRRICDLGYLRAAYKQEDGRLGWRCPSEPTEDYVRKGGLREDTVGRKCVCNGLMTNIGLGQVQADGYAELAMVTSGDDVATIARFLPAGAESYGARDVLDALLADPDLPVASQHNGASARSSV